MAQNENSNSLGQILTNLVNGVKSLLTTGSWKVEEYADKVRDAETLLDRVDEAAEQDAQLMLEQINDALVNWNRLNAKVEDARQGAQIWDEKAKTAAEKAKLLAADNPERARLAELVRQALIEKQRFVDKLGPLEKAVEESRDDYEEALKLVEQIGYTREQILSERERLDISRASAETKKTLASARRGGGNLQAKALLDQAREKVRNIEAEADAESEIAKRLPADAAQVDAELASMTRNDRVQAEFDKLMAS